MTAARSSQEHAIRVNLILFTAGETNRPLPRTDPRAAHLLDVLRRAPGEAFDAGIVNGPCGRGTVEKIGADSLLLSFEWGPPPPPADDITLLVGLPRPQTARDVLRDATTLGLARIHFVRAGRSEASYARSSLWGSGEWQRHLIAGAAQAFATQVPDVTHQHSLAEIFPLLPAGGPRLALDNYEATQSLATTPIPNPQPVVLAIGPERGWTKEDRALLREHGFTLAHLGTRVLRLETAVVAALTLVKSSRGSL